MRLTDQERIAIKKTLCYSQISRRGPASQQNYMGQHRGSQGAVTRQRKGAEDQARAFIVVSLGRSEQGSINGFEIGWFE